MKKHILLKFKKFLEKCSEPDRDTLYNVLTALRGPDRIRDMPTSRIKQVFTCKIREALGFHPVLQVLPMKKIKKLAVELENAGQHWEIHIRDALFSLDGAELLSSEYRKFFEKIVNVMWKNQDKEETKNVASK